MNQNYNKNNYNEMYPQELLALLKKIDDGEKRELLANLNYDKAALVLEEANAPEIKDILNHVDDSRLSSIISCMSSDEIADMLGYLSAGYSKKILNLMRHEHAEDIKKLLQYEEETAGSLMAAEYVALKGIMTVGEAMEKIREIEPRTEMFSYIYVVNNEKELVGVIPLRRLFLHNKDKKLEDIMLQNVISTTPDADQEKVALLMDKYDLLAMPVVNKDNKLIGIITLDDILDVIEEESTEDILKMSGTMISLEGDEGLPSDNISNPSVKDSFKLRMPWLLIALGGGIIAGGVIGAYEETLKVAVALAFFLPVIMDMGGNVGTQSATIFIRGLVLNQINKANYVDYLCREIGTGILIGLTSGGIIGVFISLWHGDQVLGFVVGFSMLLSITLATTLGSLIPWIIHLLKLDPAAGANPIITTIKDITSLIIYFLIATALLEHIG